jgi:radical SAM superfamily enzyme YgiQ (UPF0313 family)
MTPRRIITAARALVASETVLDPVATPLEPGTSPQAVLAYPNHYRTGMASLGFQSVYGMMRRHVPGPVDRVFLPPEPELETHLRTRTPLYTLEGGAPVSAARLVAFSLSYEPDLLHLVRMLDLAGIPRRAADRGERDPLVAAGGVCAAMNPAPLAPFVDLVFVGDAEVVLPRALDLIFDRRGSSRLELLEQLSGLEGLLVPALPPSRPVARLSAGPVSARRPPAHSVLVTPKTEFGSMLLAETGRGCPWHCRFCLVGCGMGRPLWSDAGLLRRTILDLPREGWNRVGLVASSAANHPQLDEICRLALEDGIPVSLPSLRASSTGDRLLQALAASGQKTVTIAPEAGSARLRALVGKREKEEDYFEFIRRLGTVRGRPFRRLKLYFIIGLPGEREDDVREIARLSAELARAAARLVPGLTVAAAAKPFVPRPHTPFQWAPMLPPAELKSRIRLLNKAVKKEKVPNLKLQAGGVVPALAQGMLALGGEEMARVLVRALDQGQSWRNAAADEGIDIDALLHQPRTGDTAFPWEPLVNLADRQGLWADYRRWAELAEDGGTEGEGA